MVQEQGTYVIGVDTGGTFTDIVALGQNGEVFTGKSPTTPWDYSIGVMNAIEEVSMTMEVSRRELLGRTRMVKHGSTVATNAVIVRGGAKVGLITTKGFEDTTLIMRAVGRVDGLAEDEIRHVTRVTKPDPIVPKELIRGVAERIDYTGDVLVPLNEDEVRAAAKDLVDNNGCKAIAVSLLQSWANPAHERRILEILEEMYPNAELFFSVGSDLIQVSGEYARTNTAVINAYVGPIVKTYLDTLEQKLKDEGLAGAFLITQGNGGAVHKDHITPIGNFQSGPAGGMMASAYMADLLNHSNVITTDMGGTSFDVGMLTNGYWRYASEPVVERFRVLQPIIDIESIGAGGGTIARVDSETNRLLVGPESAAAHPGPVAYDQGGERVATTDADLVMGILDPDYFLGGRSSLNKAKAEEYIRKTIAEPLGLDVAEAAAGVYDIINAKMADLIRRQVIRQGYLPEEFVLYCFGGAGPVHLAGFAEELGIKQAFIFRPSAVFSAFGAAAADVIHTRMLSVTYALPMEPEVLNDTLRGIEHELTEAMADEGFSPDQIVFQRYFSMRYRRQTTGVEVPVQWSSFSNQEMEDLQRLFEGTYEELYGIGAGFTRAGIEINAIRVDAIGPVSKPVIEHHAPGGSDASSAIKGYREVFFTQPERGFVNTPVYEYDGLQTGNQVAGPAVIESQFTTILVPKSWSVAVDPHQNLVMEHLAV